MRARDLLELQLNGSFNLLAERLEKTTDVEWTRRAIPGTNLVEVVAVNRDAPPGLEEAETARLLLEIVYVKQAPPPLIALEVLPLGRGGAGKPLEAFVKESIVDPNAYVQPGFPKGVMPPFNLPADQLDALVSYLTKGSK